MAGEEMQGVQVDNEEMANDYFAEYEEIDESTGESLPPEGEDPAQQQQQPSQGNRQQQEAQSGEQQQPTTPQGFSARFYKQGDDGSQQFDPEAFHGFAFNPNGPRFAYQRQQAAQQMPNQQPAQGNQQPEEEVPVWKKPVVERQRYEEQLRERMLYPIQRMREQLGQNLDPNTRMFLERQERLAIEHIRDELVPKWQCEQEETWRKQQYEEIEQRDRARQYEVKANTNIGALANEAGIGNDGLSEFFFGKQGPDGKHIPGPATDALNYFFDRDNPDAARLTGQQLQDAYQRWWNEFASNRANLNMLWDFGVAKLQREHWPDMVGKVRATQDTRTQQQHRGAVSQPSGGNHIAGQGGNVDAGHQQLQQYLTNEPATF